MQQTDWLAPFATRLEQRLRDGGFPDKRALHQWKQRTARDLGAPGIPKDADLNALLPADLQETWRMLLQKKPARSQSGVAVVAVMSSPAGCPHGKCVYCPGGPEVDAPQSYTGFEPSTMRAKRFDYDPYRIVRTRLGQLRHNGHSTDKVDIVIQGGTFPARDRTYRDWFVAAIYAGLDDGPAMEDPGAWMGEAQWAAMDPEDQDAMLEDAMVRNESATCRAIGLTIETKPDWCLAPHVDEMLRYGTTRVELGIQTLDDAVLALTNRGHTVQQSRDAMRIARDAGLKICAHLMPGQPRPTAGVASTLGVERSERPGQPRPTAGVASMLGAERSERPGQPRPTAGVASMLGAERSERPGQPRPTAGVASTLGAEGSEPRDQPRPPQGQDRNPGAPGASDDPVAHAPQGVDARAPHYPTDPDADVEDARRLFSEPDWRPDMLKIYPTLVVMEGETSLKKWWRQGRFEPYDTATACDVIARMKAHVPEYCRIQRIDRDIPTTHLEAGVMNSNIRQMAQEEMARRGMAPCACIRCREVARRMTDGADVDPAQVRLVRRDYEAAGGQEAFLALEDPEADAVIGFIRLRRPGRPHRPELQHPDGTVVVRELKVYGSAQAIGAHDAGAWQHQGHGKALMEAAERVAFDEWGVGRLAVIAGVGVKAYYRDRGYHDLGPYVARTRPAAQAATDHMAR